MNKFPIYIMFGFSLETPKPWFGKKLQERSFYPKHDLEISKRETKHAINLYLINHAYLEGWKSFIDGRQVQIPTRSYLNSYCRILLRIFFIILAIHQAEYQ